jgi:hypothetical protein
MDRLDGQGIAITGGAGGIGAAMRGGSVPARTPLV